MTPTKRVSIPVSLPKAVREQIECAAAVAGESLSAFMRKAAVQRANRVHAQAKRAA